VISRVPKNPSKADNAERRSFHRTSLLACSSKSLLDYVHINASTRKCPQLSGGLFRSTDKSRCHVSCSDVSMRCERFFVNLILGEYCERLSNYLPANTFVIFVLQESNSSHSISQFRGPFFELLQNSLIFPPIDISILFPR